MKALRVYESLDFKRGEDPHDALGVGIWPKPKIIEWFNKYLPNVRYELYLPDYVIIKDNVHLSDEPVYELPEKLIVEGELYMYRCPIKRLPEGLKVYGALDIGETNISELPNNLDVEILDIRGTKLEEKTNAEILKGKNIHVRHRIIRNNKTFESLDFKRGEDPHSALGVGSIYKTQEWLDRWFPDVYHYVKDGRVHTDAELQFNIWNKDQPDYIPDNLTVGGYLNMEYITSIKELPKGLEVFGDLYLDETVLTELPPDLYVGENLYVMRRVKIPDTVRVGNEIRIMEDIEH